MASGNNPQYFYDYGKVFSFVFDSGFDDYSLEEIKGLPSDWGIDSDASANQ